MRLHVGSMGLRTTLALACCLVLGGGLSGCVSKAKYERALAANQACQQRVAEQDQRLSQLHASLTDAHLAVTGQPAGAEMTDEQIVAVLRTSISDRDKELASYRGEADKTLTYQLLAKYLFPSGSAQLTPQGRDALEKVAVWLKESDANNIFVQGFTDDVPIGKNLKRKYVSNWELSTHRATTVVRFLADQGVPEDRLIAAGYGEMHPEAEGGDEVARQQNRRIEIKLNNGQFKEIIARIPDSVSPDSLIDVNRATVAELVVLPGMTPDLARSIVDYRARAGGFTSYNDLSQVRGFDTEKMEPIKSMITFGGQRGTDPLESTGSRSTDDVNQPQGGAASGATTGSSSDSSLNQPTNEQQRSQENMYLVPKEKTDEVQDKNSGSPKNTYPRDDTRSDSELESDLNQQPGQANPY